MKAMALSGVLPVVAIFIQFSHIGFIIIHNNPSFAETFRIENYVAARPVGLTNEASFFVYQLLFSAIALYYAWKEKIINNTWFFLLTISYIL
ncbi:hypothetical protein, partial [Ectopseudomonas mendocina]|uniref:hypothetical protein n=1 Tax=Ectopseudomonas mendocina TaxID=300 RepID=UPI0031333A9E